jgi:antitoxin ParD1/3/4
MLATVASVDILLSMARGSTLNVSLTASLDRYVREKVASGGYESASEVIRESLRLSLTMEQAQDLFWAAAREKVAVARKQVARGQLVDGPAAMDQIISELADRSAKKKKRT